MDTPITREMLLPLLEEQPEKLVEMVLQQADLIAALQAEVERLKRDNGDWRQRLQELEKAPLRPAAPFRIAEKKRKDQRRKPGRKKGHVGAYRHAPQQIDETVEVPLQGCPHCGETVTRVSRVEQFIEDLPVVRPHVTRVVTYRGRCGHCGWVRSRHPMQVSTATGAAGTQIGPRALGTAMHLLQEGLTRRKVCGVLRELFGLRLTPGGLVQAAHRMGRRLAQGYDALQRQVRASTSIHVDETSWWVDGPKWWLWVFTRPELTLYRVVPSRAREVIKETLGAEYGGVLVSDCLVVYDNVCARQQKCYAHHLKAIGQAIERHERGGEGFLQAIRQLLKSALLLKSAWAGMSERARQETREHLTLRARDLLRAPPEHPLEAAVAQRLRKQEDHLFTFLEYPEVEATNNLAERQLRPAVIARKISCGNRTERGARTWEILASLAATARQNARAFRELVAHAALLAPEEGR